LNWEADEKLRYDNPKEAFCRTLLVDDLYTGENAIATTIPIHDPCEAHATAVASMASAEMGMLKMNSSANAYKILAMTICRCRRLAINDQGYMGLVPECTKLGDGVYILAGVSVPSILRDREDCNFILVGVILS
jgi:hypothetical protein